MKKNKKKKLDNLYIFSSSISRHLIKTYFKIKNYKLIFTNEIAEAQIVILLNKHFPKIKKIVEKKKIIVFKCQNKNYIEAKFKNFQKNKTNVLDILKN